ncbi:MAG: SprB repeat-containing protein, partial [Bacteroidetes bacterium]|nr:SprB repeat-containing protein [Bacteroidota bacterium]
AGDYTVLIRDGNGCTFSATYTINDGITITLSETIEPVSCNGGSDGAISLEVNGGATPYTFIWSNGANTQNISGLLAGDYTVEVGDANGCTTRATYTITEPLALALTLIAEDATTCGGSEGSINLSVEGGTGTYTYLWSNSETTEDISGLRAGDYEVTVTDAKGCSATAAVTIGQPAGISSLSAIISNISCSGLTDGSINLTVEGGLAPYSFAWDNGATTEDLTGLAEGTYQVVVTDAANCQASETFTISEPALLDVKGTVTHLSCAGDNNGAIDITVSGGTGAYTFEWSNGATTEDLENLAAGDYTILIRDGNGCTFSASYTINEPSALSTTTAVTHISSCTGNDGAVDLTVSGGTAPYAYEWSNGVTDQDLTALAAGTYTVIITDVSGCTATASATVEQARVMEISATATDVTSCAESNGRIDVTISGGGAPYSYSWSNGATTEDLTGLGVGTYALTVTDANGCTEMVEATIGAPDGISELTAAIVNVDCYGAATGAIDLTVVGGQAPYTYRWSNEANSEDLTALVAGTYSVEVTDANACVATQTFNIAQPVAALALSAQLENTTACQAADGAIDLSVSGGTAPYTYVWSNGATTEDLSALIAGTYSVDVTDAAACTISASFTISDASGPEIAAAVTHVLCSGTNTGAIELTVTSGTAPYTYSWSSGASTSNISELASGTYTVTVTDSNGCNAVAEIEVTEPQMLIADAVAEAISCQGEADGSINLTVSGGVAPYQYQWTKDGVAITADTEVLNNLDAGIYEVTVTDANGCIVGASATVSEPAALQASISGTTSLCAGDTNGSLEASASGGTGSYSYLWNTGATTAAIDGLPAGTYEVSVTDANSCTTMASFTISEEQVVVNLGPDRSACAPASIELLSGYSTDTHDILWSTGETTASIVVSTTDIYSVTVTNRTSGCSGTDDVLVEIENSFEPAVSIAPVNEITCNSEQIILDASITHGGDAPRFQWYRNGDAIGGATEQQYDVGVFNNGDNFSVEVTSSLSCADPQVVYAEYQLILPQVEAPQLSASEAEVCQGGDMPIITETAGGTMRWYYDAANPTNPRIDRSLIIYEGTAFAPSAADYGVGTHNFLVTQTTVHCGESMDWATFALLMTGQECTVPVCEVTPSVSVKILPGSEICPDIRTLTLEADTADIGENPQYAWYYNGTLFSSEAAPSYTSTGGFANGDEFMVEITITDERFICNGNNTISNASTITLVEEIQATAQIQPIDPVCADSNIPVVITADGTYIDWRSEGLGTVYTWYINDVQVQQDTLLGEASTANQLEIVPSELPADAVVRLQVSLPAEISCVLPPADATYAIPFAEPTAPTVSLSSSAPAGACPGTTVTFTASATNAGTNPRYIFT